MPDYSADAARPKAQALEAGTMDRLDHLEDDVWALVRKRTERTRHLTLSVGALALIAVFAGSYSLGASRANQELLRKSVADALSEDSHVLGGEFG